MTAHLLPVKLGKSKRKNLTTAETEAQLKWIQKPHYKQHQHYKTMGNS